jgi:hypothetical protein
MKLEISDKQAHVIIEALDVYSRIGMGQLEAVPHLISSHALGVDAWSIIDRFTDPMKRELFGHPPGGSYSIVSGNVPVPFQIAYEMQCVIRKDIASREDYQKLSVWHDGPMSISGEPFAKVIE